MCLCKFPVAFLIDEGNGNLASVRRTTVFDDLGKAIGILLYGVHGCNIFCLHTDRDQLFDLSRGQAKVDNLANDFVVEFHINIDEGPQTPFLNLVTVGKFQSFIGQLQQVLDIAEVHFVDPAHRRIYLLRLSTWDP